MKTLEKIAFTAAMLAASVWVPAAIAKAPAPAVSQDILCSAETMSALPALSQEDCAHLKQAAVLPPDGTLVVSVYQLRRNPVWKKLSSRARTHLRSLDGVIVARVGTSISQFAENAVSKPSVVSLR